MKNRVLELVTPGVAVHLERGSLRVKVPDQEARLIPLDTVGVALLGSGTLFSVSAVSALLNSGSAVLITGENFLPLAQLWPLEGHHLQRKAMLAQVRTSQPFRKNLWKLIVIAKVRAQRDVLSWRGIRDESFNGLLLKVSSGDSLNIEAQAARKYWPHLFGKEFRRDPQLPGVNALLNYGYAVLRAACARAVSGSGLHPSFSVFHESKQNAFALVDDLMEPFRPIVDAMVFRWCKENPPVVQAEAKKYLVSLLNLSVAIEDGTNRNFSDYLFDYARGVSGSMIDGKARISLRTSFLHDFLQLNAI